MEYSSLFSSVSEQLQISSEKLNPHQVGRRIKLADKSFKWEELQFFKICLITFRRKEDTHGYTALRENFYTLYFQHKSEPMVDLGDYIYNSENPADTERKLLYIAEKLLIYKVFPIVISEQVHWGYIFNKLHCSLSNLHNHALIIHHANNIKTTSDNITIDNLIFHLRTQICKRTFDTLSLLAFQTHKTNPEDIENYTQQYIDAIRLGLLRSNINLAEPLLRFAEHLMVDMSSMRYADFSATPSHNPNGLHSEELCELVYFGSSSVNLQSSTLMNFNTEKLLKENASLMAEVLWFICDGIANRINEYPIPSPAMHNQHTVNIDLYTEPLVFYQSRITNHWWVEIEDANRIKRYIPCNHEDYLQTANGELSDRWLWNLKRYNQK